MVHNDHGGLHLLIILALLEEVVIIERLLQRFLRLHIHRRINFIPTAVQLVFRDAPFTLRFLKHIILKSFEALVPCRGLIIIHDRFGVLHLGLRNIALFVH
ncbi:hypothetical protein D3C77_450830 [compost metagenome]